MDSATTKPGTTTLLRVPVAALRAGAWVLDADAAHYLTRVHRMQVGQAFLAFDPEQGLVARGRISEVGRAAVRCEFEAPTAARVQRALHCVLVQGLGKADKPERVVRAATELGVDGVLFTRMQRSVATLEHHAESRLGRLRAVALDAARQSGRPDLPQLEYAADLQQALQRVPAGATRLLCDPEGEAGLASRLAHEGRLQAVVVIVGPEGGLTSQERDLAFGAGFLPWRLADYVLRTETAALSALSALVTLAVPAHQ